MEMFLVRVGDAERDACMVDLNEHHVLGRLSVEELDRRQRAALSAVTAADLAALVADLPHDTVATRHDRPASSGGSRESRRRVARMAATWAGPPVALVTTSTVVTGSISYFSQEAVFTGNLITGVVGFVSCWVFSRLERKRRQEARAARRR
jgi:hypothetical protein